jgi:hypothetical protein
MSDSTCHIANTIVADAFGVLETRNMLSEIRPHRPREGTTSIRGRSAMHNSRIPHFSGTRSVLMNRISPSMPLASIVPNLAHSFVVC